MMMLSLHETKKRDLLTHLSCSSDRGGMEHPTLASTFSEAGRHGPAHAGSFSGSHISSEGQRPHWLYPGFQRSFQGIEERHSKSLFIAPRPKRKREAVRSCLFTCNLLQNSGSLRGAAILGREEVAGEMLFLALLHEVWRPSHSCKTETSEDAS